LPFLGNYSNGTKPNEFNLFTSDDPPIKPFIFGTDSGPNDLDPQNAWDSPSNNVIDQVCEGLFAHNLTNLENEIIPNLATGDGTWSVDNLNFTVPLRTGVSFHDGTAFNATAVNFTFSRLLYFFENDLSSFVSLYEFSDGTSIINRTEIVDTFTIKFVLNRPFGAFQALLCFGGSYILSPTSTPATTLIDTATGDLVGTGPFVYDTYNVGTNVTFHAYENYWRGKASIEEMVFKIYTNSTKMNNALLSKEIHFISNPPTEYFDNITSDPDLTFIDQDKTGTALWYLGMNNKQINTTIREAISYAINYTYIIDELREGQAERLKSPLPLGTRYANWTFEVPILNLSYARQVMQSMGFGVGWNVTPGSSNEANWQAATFLTYNYTYNFGNSFREDLLVLLQDNLGKIGINVIDAGMPWDKYLNRIFEMGGMHRNMLQLFWEGCAIDYNDPYIMLKPLFTNRTSASNCAQYDGYEAAKEAGRDPLALNDNVQLLKEAGLSETDPFARETIYDRIQELLIEHDRPGAWGYVKKIYDASHVALSGFQQNTFKKLNFYSCQWNYYNYSMEITHPQDINYIEGSVGNAITWNITAKDIYNATYSIYIDDILNQTGSWEVGVPVNPLTVQISHPDDVSYINGSTGNSITWYILTNLELNTIYYVYQNDSLFDTGGWQSGSPVTINIDDFTEGSYEFRIEAHSGSTIEEDIVILTVEPLAIQISHPDDVSYYTGTIGHTITWTITTNLELNTIYYVYQDETLFDTGGWQSGSPVTIIVDGLSEGIYEFRIEAHSGSTIEDDIVIVTVISEDPIIPGFDVFIVSFTVIIGIGFISWQAKRKLKKL
jgi:peptide/nickel transport system substrate-binding protein